MPTITRKPDERESLVLRFVPSARRIARVWGNTASTREEAECDLFVKLVELIDKTPDEKLTEAYVSECLRNCLRQAHVRQKNKQSRIPESLLVSLDAPAGHDPDDHGTIGDFILDQNAERMVEESALNEDFILKVLANLTDLQRKIVTRHLGLDDMDATEMSRVAKALRISRTAAYLEFAAAKGAIREQLRAIGLAPKSDAHMAEVLRHAA